MGLGFACVVLVHLALMLMKIKFVNSSGSDFEGLDIPRLVSHRHILSSVDSQNSRFV